MTLIVGIVHLVISITAAIWAYRMYSLQHHFVKLPTSEPEPEQDDDGVALDMLNRDEHDEDDFS